MKRVLAVLFFCLLVWSSTAASLSEDKPLRHTFTDWLDHPAIQYAQQPTADPIADLMRKIQAGQVSLTKDATSGYLRSLLDAMKVSISSQIAVFAKDSAQSARIEANNPRTIFFNDNIAIGWVRGGYIEIAAQDPRQGVVFYTIDELAGQPYFRRRDDCLSCHYNYSTVGVPGMIVRSAGQFSAEHSVPLEKRWGGWYVTGRLGSIRHLGNIDPIVQSSPQNADNLNWESFNRKFDATGYLSTQSDIGALMVFEHQMHMMNLLSRIGWEVRVAQHQKAHGGAVSAADDTPIPADEAATEIVDYMLFIDEAPVPGKIEGATAFAQQFSSLGERDRKGRSLRALRMNSRMMEYPCSYMIYSAQFDNLPAEAKDAIYRRLWRILSGQERSARYEKLSRADRVAITEILLDTKQAIPNYFQTASIQ